MLGGKIKIGNDSQAQTAGQIRWTGSDYEGFDGTTWKSFTAQGGGGGGVVTCPTCRIYASPGYWQWYQLTSASGYSVMWSGGPVDGDYPCGSSVAIPNSGVGFEGGSFSCNSGTWFPY